MTRILLVALLLFSATASADPSPDSLAEARRHYSAGKTFHDAGKYDEAIAEYRAAQALAPHPDLIFNIGQCQRLKGDRRAALATYQTYLAASPEGRGAPEARAHVETLTREIAAEEPSVKPATPPILKPTPTSTSTSTRTSTSTSTPGSNLRIAGMVTAGAGLLLLAGGGFFALRASSIADEVDSLGGPDHPWDPDLYQSGKDADRNAVILTVAGGATLTAGAVLYYLGVRSGREVPVTVATDGRNVMLVVARRF